MRVLLDASFADRGPSGTAVYIERLAAALRERGDVELVEARQRVRMRPGGGNPLRSAGNALLDLAWLHVGLPRAARAAEADVVHHPLPQVSPRIRAAQVVTLHDLDFVANPEDFGRVWRIVARRRLGRAVREAGALVSVSNATAGDANLLLGAEEARVVVAPHGPGQVEAPLERSAEPAHFLYVGDAQGRKDVRRLLDAYAAYREHAERPLELVLAGRAGRLAGAEGVRGEHSPDGERLLELMAKAAALVHPSRREGFGLTVLEAMAAGVPVVAVANAGVREVAGKGALIVESADLPAALARVAVDPALREELGTAGMARAREFSWAESARRHERAYTLAVASHGRATQ